ncbi:histone-like nucleoid-structuring protein Lsr2 [Streptomyces sp. NPDC088387]|uniref:WhiB family transcriptional regulator n=1 Tax=Streptomyces sp. NPDC088387 TaxID=3365859 RepID=UPI003811D3B7
MTTAARDAADWRPRAACRGQDTNRWFDAPGGRYGSAQQTCNGCPVRAECLHDALNNEPACHRYGLWGGLTGGQRRAIHTAGGPMTIAALRRLLAEIDEQGGPEAARHNRLHIPDERPDERTSEPMTQPIPTAPAPIVDVQLKAGADVRLRESEALPVGQLLTWADDHPEPDIRDQAARARAALAGLRQRHAADRELTAITTEAAQLEKRLAELRAREAELAPSKRAKRKPSSHVRDYDSRTVRAWADENGIECPSFGQIPKGVLEAWRAAQQEGARS